MKMAGAMLVIMSCSVFGLSMARSLKVRALFLQDLVRALTLLRSELCGSLLPVGDALALLSDDKNNSSREFFIGCMELLEEKGLREAWTASALGTGAWGLEADECAQLAALGGVIGRYEAEKQGELIDRTIAYFVQRAETADEDKRRQCKLRTSLGVGSGLMLAILML